MQRFIFYKYIYVSMGILIGYIALTIFVGIILLLIVYPFSTLEDNVFLSPPSKFSFSFLCSIFLILIVKDIILLMMLLDHKFKLEKLLLKKFHRIK